jgi:hypothetical protein
MALLLAAGPVAADEGITIETSVGPVTCAPDPERAPGPAAITSTPFADGLKVTVAETGALRCATPAFGAVEVIAAGLPWQLTVNEKRAVARLRGTPKPALLLQSVELPSLVCRYQVGRVLGTLTSGTALSVSLAATRVRLNRAVSSAPCPALGPLDLDVTLP